MQSRADAQRSKATVERGHLVAQILGSMPNGNAEWERFDHILCCSAKSRLVAHLLRERLIGKHLNQDICQNFYRSWPCGARALPSSKDKNNTPLEIREIQSVGGDQTEEKRYAAAITRVAEFRQ
jgi:hypothetical protein